MAAATPYFPVPPGSPTTVKVIDTTSKIGKLKVSFLMDPPVPGFKYMPDLPSWSFLVESPGGGKALFDLGIPKDWENMAPVTATTLRGRGWDIMAERNTSEILVENGVALEEIHAIVWR